MPAHSVDLTSGLVKDWIPVTPNDGANNMGISSENQVVGFYVSGTGQVTFTVDGVDRVVTFPSNFMVPCTNVTRIKATGTAATGIFSLVV